MAVTAADTCEIRECEVCSASIEHLRSDATVCSASCRARRARGEDLYPPGRCEHCGATLPPGRADRKFCSGRCRTAAHRAKACKGVSAAGCGCGGTATYVDQDGERICVSCGRLT